MHSLEIKNHHGSNFEVETFITICANPDCLKPSVFLRSGVFIRASPPGKVVTDFQKILPEPGGKIFENVPNEIWQDYHEACRIVELSPKASATLARRCLQHMIYDFWHITKGRLVDQINAVAEKAEVSAPIKVALHSVRELGNIGAHPEADINTIVDIEPGEAELIIRVIEMLFVAWYDRRAEEARLLSDIQALSAEKKQQK